MGWIVFCVVYSQSFRTESCKMVLLKIGETDTRDIAVCLLHRGKLPLLAADPTESRRSLCCGSPLLWDDRKINNHQHSATFCNIPLKAVADGESSKGAVQFLEIFAKLVLLFVELMHP